MPGMMARVLSLTVLPGRYAVCRMEPGASIPPWATAGPLCSVTRTAEELSILCPAERVPPAVRQAGDWRALKIEGPFDFTAIGVLASVATPLAAAGISLFALSTFDTDYLLVNEATLDRAVAVLLEAGHQVRR
jgi:hypothetical protein